MKTIQARKIHQPLILELLKRNDLPVQDIDFQKQHFYVCLEGEELLAAGALEDYKSAVLLRSIAVKNKCKGKGIGSRFVEELLSKQTESPVFLLTEHADGFFKKLGFRVIERDQVPPDVLMSPQFAEICPSSATCMKR